MDGISIAFGLGGLIVGGIAGIAGVLGVLFARNGLEFEKKKWEESNKPNIKVEQIFLPETSDTFQLIAVNVGIPPVTLKYVGFRVGELDDVIFLIPPEHTLLHLPHRLERWDQHDIILSYELVASMLKDDGKHNGSVVLTVFFKDTLGETYRSMTSSTFDIDKWYVEPPTEGELEGGERSPRSLFGVGTAGFEALKESRINQS